MAPESRAETLFLRRVPVPGQIESKVGVGARLRLGFLGGLGLWAPAGLPEGRGFACDFSRGSLVTSQFGSLVTSCFLSSRNAGLSSFSDL